VCNVWDTLNTGERIRKMQRREENYATRGVSWLPCHSGLDMNWPADALFRGPSYLSNSGPASDSFFFIE